MLVEMRPIDSIRPYENNPRLNDAGVDAVAVIIVGSTRFKAALKLGLKEVPVHVALGLSPAQLKAYRIADNKTAELADWNEELLVQELGELKDLEFDVNLLGFSSDELQELMQVE